MTGTVTERILPTASRAPAPTREVSSSAPATSAPAPSREAWSSAPATNVAEARDPASGPGTWPTGQIVAGPVRVPPPDAPAAALARAARLAKPRGEALLTTTTRAGMLVGVSAAIYAVSLAAVAGLQAQTQADVAAQNQPAIDAVAQAKAANDALEAAIQDADARARALTADYGAVSKDMTAYQAQFAKLSDLVAKIQGSAAKLNSSFTLPTVTMHGAISGGGSSTTVVVTTTTASGKP